MITTLTSRRLAAVLAVCLSVVAALVAGPPASAALEDENLKYYLVRESDGGRPETLAAIAGRYLSDPGRSDDILALNTGRIQPDGDVLRDPDQLHAGWVLVLPWDAYGDGVSYGRPPTKAPDRPGVGPGSGATGGTGVPVNSSPSPGAPAPTRTGCSARPATGSVDDWARRRLAADQVWTRTQGAGVVVAVLDSGIDGGRPELAGRVLPGADVRAGSDRGRQDCWGSGTAMAGIVGAKPVVNRPTAGVAPQATLLPVRVVHSGGPAAPADVEAGIVFAVSEGANVIAVGPSVDLAEPTIARAVEAAVDHGVLVVVPAAKSVAATAATPTAGKGVLRVAGVGRDGQRAEDYAAGGVDVVAPGIEVAGLDLGDAGPYAVSGTAYAVAAVAGTAALARAAHPRLDPAQLFDLLTSTADASAATVPDSASGWGMIDPRAAVAAQVSDQHQQDRAPAAGLRWHGAVPAAVLIAIVLMAATALAWARRRDREHTRSGDRR